MQIILSFQHCLCCACTDSVEDGEKLIQTALDAFGRIGKYCLWMEIMWPSGFIIQFITQLLFKLSQ